MSFRKLIDSNLRKAFVLLKDLSKNVTFNSKIVGEFDFETELPSSETITSKTIKAIIMNEDSSKQDSKKEDRNIFKSEIMFKKQDLGDITNYDTVTIDNLIWSIGKSIKNDGHIVLLEIHREK